MAKSLVDREAGTVARAVYSDQSIYEREIERIFARCWLFLGHEVLVPEPGDFMTTSMGEDPVIVWRDQNGGMHAFLNTCRHRGNRVCLFGSGNAGSMTCGYHGWTYSSEGKLVGVPFTSEAYYDDLDRAQWGLIEVPRLQSYGGLIFGSWDGNTISLDDYLGDLRWYLDRLVLLAEDLGGFDLLASCRYDATGNWKIPAENFAGDHYHTPTTHGSSFKLGLRASEFGGPQEPAGPFEIAIKPGHGLGGLVTGDATFERDLKRAAPLGQEATDYVRERYRRLLERTADSAAKPYGFSHANIFPNCSLWGGGAFRGSGFFMFHPRGPLKTEVCQTVLIPRDAPEAVRQVAYEELGRGGHFPTGLFEQDDANNFERVTEGTRSFIARQYPFNFGMGIRQEGQWPGRETWDVEGLPGLVGPRFSEHAQRLFYAYWSHLVEG